MDNNDHKKRPGKIGGELNNLKPGDAKRYSSQHAKRRAPVKASDSVNDIQTDNINSRKVRLTFFKDEQAAQAFLEGHTLPELAAHIKGLRGQSKEALPWLKMAEFGDKRTELNCLRSNANVLRITGIEAEHDKGTVTFDQAEAILRAAKVRGIVYTSPSYKPGEKERWRFIAPSSQPLAPGERERLVGRINGLFNGAIEDESFVLSQAFLFGHVDNPHHRVEVIDGQFVDLRPDLDAGAIGKRGERPNGAAADNPFANYGDEVFRRGRTDEELHALLLSTNEPGNWHQPMRDVVATLVGRRLPNSMISLICSPHFHPDRGQAELDMLIQTARRKWNVPDSDAQFNNTPSPNQSVGSDLVRASDIEMREREWLWHGHLLKGALELLTGLPGLGKSQVQIDYVACVTSGKPWPDGAAGSQPANVIMLTAEDALDTEILPRLKAAGADLDRVYILKCIHTDKKTKRQFLLGEDLGELKKRITEVRDNTNEPVGLVTIDPITAYMGSIDSHRATDVRGQLGPLKDLAEETNIAFSAITHPPKASKQSAIDSFIGSQAFVAACRVGHMCVKEFDDENEETGRVLYAHVKYNSSARMPTLAYQVEIVVLGQGLRGVIDAPRVEWAAESVDLTADQALAASRSTDNAQGKVQALIWDMLQDGPVATKDIDSAAKANGFTDKQIRMAKERLKIEFHRDGPGATWRCHLPGGQTPQGGGAGV